MEEDWKNKSHFKQFWGAFIADPNAQVGQSHTITTKKGEDKRVTITHILERHDNGVDVVIERN